MKIKHFLIYFLISLTIITISFFTTEPNQYEFNTNQANISDIFYLFALNSFHITFMLLSSFFGYHFFLIIDFFIHMGQAGAANSVSASNYYLSSFIHGTLEILATFFVVAFSFHIYKYLYYNVLFKGHALKDSRNKWRKLPFYIICMYTVVFIGAVIEVLYANRLIVFLEG